MTEIKDLGQLFNSVSNSALIPVQDAEVTGRISKANLLAGLSGAGSLAPWKIINTDYQAVAGDRLLIDLTSSLTITLPSNPTAGTEIDVFIGIRASETYLFLIGLTKYNGQSTNKIGTTTLRKPLKLIYFNETLGWVSEEVWIAINSVKSFSSHGDTNGAFYHIGSAGLTQSWANPYTANRIGISFSSFLSSQSPIASLVDRQPSAFHTDTQSNPWIQFDLKAGNNLILNHWSYRTRATTLTHVPNRLIVSGSNDNSVFTQIDDFSFTPTENNWFGRAVSGQTIAYRYIRFTMPYSGYFTAGEFELYGSLTWAL